MSSPNSESLPKFKNINIRPKQSPQEIKEKMRKNYKSRIQNCRDALREKFRGQICEKSLCNITELYRNMFNFPAEPFTEEESTILEEIKKELLNEEMQWLLNEYDKFEMDGIDLASNEQDHVICPLCQKENFKLIKQKLTCPHCDVVIKTENSLSNIKMLILNNVEQHAAICSQEAQFNSISEPSGAHIYLMCESCNEMKLII